MRRGHRIVHDHQHVAAALVCVGIGGQRARLELAAQGDLTMHRRTHRHTHRLGVSTTGNEGPGTRYGKGNQLRNNVAKEGKEAREEEKGWIERKRGIKRVKKGVRK